MLITLKMTQLWSASKPTDDDDFDISHVCAVLIGDRQSVDSCVTSRCIATQQLSCVW